MATRKQKVQWTTFADFQINKINFTCDKMVPVVGEPQVRKLKPR